MTAYTPPPEAVEAAAKVIAENTDEPGWSAVVIARDALTAAGPIIAAGAECSLLNHENRLAEAAVKIGRLKAELYEARQQVADLRAGIEALLPGETVNVYAGGGNLVSQRRVVDPDHLRALLAGSGEQPGKGERAWLNADPRKAAENLRAVVGASEQPGEGCVPCETCGRDQRAGWCKHPAPAVPDVVRELDAVMHHHADRADAAEAEVDRLAALLDVAQEDLAAAEAPVVPDDPVVREARRLAWERYKSQIGRMADAYGAFGYGWDQALAAVRPSGQEGS